MVMLVQEVNYLSRGQLPHEEKECHDQCGMSKGNNLPFSFLLLFSEYDILIFLSFQNALKSIAKVKSFVSLPFYFQ